MICPFCNKEIVESTGFCPECGQKLVQLEQSSKTENYWNEINRADSQRLEQYKDLVNKSIKERSVRINRAFMTLIFVAVIVIAIVVGNIKYHAYSAEKLSDVQAQLIGKTFIAHSTHVEGLGWVVHEYRQLTFKDTNTLDYAYIGTRGARDENELPEYEGTYNYTVSRSITGSYKISTDGTAYELEVNDDNEVQGISQK